MPNTGVLMISTVPYLYLPAVVWSLSHGCAPYHGVVASGLTLCGSIALYRYRLDDAIHWQADVRPSLDMSIMTLDLFVWVLNGQLRANQKTVTLHSTSVSAEINKSRHASRHEYNDP